MDGFRIEHPIDIEDLGVPGNLPICWDPLGHCVEARYCQLQLEGT